MAKRPQGSATLPEPPSHEAAKRLSLQKPAGVIDGRKARYKGRRVQFNTRVSENFTREFDAAMMAELEAAAARGDGRQLSRPYFLELLLATWKRQQGEAVAPFGLSPAALEGARAIAAKTGWELSQVIEDALVARCKDLQIGNRSK
ncbi:MAG: hypothetical protein JSS20_17095 [Proteobacteria bacterium]|nr:hypothetical protein [Pseudomonadota bacterium]